jgi:hypothetical protein
MATVTPTPAHGSAPVQAPVEPAKGDQRVELVGIGWEGYEALLKVQGEKSRPQMTYPIWAGMSCSPKTSVAFPFLTAAEIFDWAARPGMPSMTQWILEVRQWIQEVLVSRVQGQGG